MCIVSATSPDILVHLSGAVSTDFHTNGVKKYSISFESDSFEVKGCGSSPLPLTVTDRRIPSKSATTHHDLVVIAA